mgnify:FL=1
MRYQFQQPGPGRPKGSVSGRRQALALLDEILGEEDSKRAMRDALRQHLQKNPVAFFRQLVMPLLPSEAKIEVDNSGGTVGWRSFLDVPEGKDLPADQEAKPVT